jgi:hypothetical protein
MNTVKDLSAHANRSEMAMTESGVAGGKNMMLSIRNEAEDCDCAIVKSQNEVNEKSYLFQAVRYLLVLNNVI